MTDTSANNKRIAKNTFILYVRMLCTMGISLYTSRIILDTLGIEDFGIYNAVGGVIAVWGFINSAMSNSTSRYLTYYLGLNNLTQLKKTFTTSLLIHLLIACIILIIAETIGLWFLYEKMNIPYTRFNAAFWVYQLTVLSSVISVLAVPYNASIISHEKMGAFAYITIIDVTIKLAIVYILYAVESDKLITYSLLLLISQILIQCVYMLYCRHKFKECTFSLKLDKSLFKEMSSFAGWSFIGNIAYVTYTHGLNLLLNVFFGPSVNAARGIAVQVQSAIVKFITSFQTAINPQITKSYAEKNYLRLYQLIHTSTRYSFYLSLFLALPVLIHTEFILDLWLKKYPEYTISFTRIMIVISMMNIFSNPCNIAAQATGTIKRYQQVEGGLLLSILPISYFALYCSFSPNSVFYINLFICIITQIARIIILHKLIKLSYAEYIKEISRILLVIILSSLFSLSISHIITVTSFIDFLLFTFTICLTNILIIFFIGIPNTEKQFILQKIQLYIKPSNK